jgi:hypothetical protein
MSNVFIPLLRGAPTSRSGVDAPKSHLIAYNERMQNKLIKIFQEAKYEPESDLSENIWRKIIVRDKKMTQIKMWTFSFLGFISLAGLVPALRALSGDLAQSGFSEYFSLIFSDTSSMLSSWKELFFSLAESLPIISLISALSLLFIFFLSIKYIVKQINNNHPIGKTYGVA